MVYFREVQRFRQPWLWGILLLGSAPVAYVLIYGRRGPIHAYTLVPLALVLWLPCWFYLMKLVTEVHDDAIRVHMVWGWRPKRIPFGEIRRVEAVTYRPIAEYGGWGIRKGGNGWAYNVSGDHGVRIHYTNGKEFLIGSQRAGELAQAIQARMSLPR